MRRQWFAVLASAVALIASGSAQGPSSDTVKPFNGTSLAGWRTQGPATWRAAGGEIVGSAASGPGSLVLEKSYQDIILRFAYRCDGCDAGVFVRSAAQPSKPGTDDRAVRRPLRCRCTHAAPRHARRATGRRPSARISTSGPRARIRPGMQLRDDPRR